MYVKLTRSSWGEVSVLIDNSFISCLSLRRQEPGRSYSSGYEHRIICFGLFKSEAPRAGARRG